MASNLQSTLTRIPVSAGAGARRVLGLGAWVCLLASCTLDTDREGLFEAYSSGGTGAVQGPPPGMPGPASSGNPGPGGGSAGLPGVNLPLDASVVVPPVDAAASGIGDAAEPLMVGAPCGYALSLDGTNDASIARVVEDDFTLEAWIKTATSRTGTTAFYSRPVFDADFIGLDFQDDFAAGVLDDRFVFGVGNPDTTLRGSTVVTTDEWVHVAVTRQRATGQIQVIVNGALDGVAVAPNQNALSAPPRISFGGASFVRNFIGLIDDVRLWNVVRSVEDIASSMRSRLSGSEAGLVGYYTFEDRGASETADLSATAQPATITGNPSYAPAYAPCLTP